MSVTSSPNGYFVAAGSGAITLASATPAGTNTWTELIASTSTSVLLVGIRWDLRNNSSGTIDIGTGAAAAEVSILSWYGYGWATDGNTGTDFPLALPLRVPAGTRVSCKTSTTGNAIGVYYVNEGNIV